MNPNAILLMVFGTSVGYAMYGDLRSAALGLAITSGLLLLIGMTRV